LMEVQFEGMKERILLFEDEPAIAENLVYALETEGFLPLRVGTAQEGLALLARGDFDLVVLDVGLPDMNGFEVCKRIRATSMVPIFFLTARSDELDRVLGLEIGADDYIVKPFSPREVTARVKALFRRLAGRGAASASAGPFEIDEAKRRILFRGRDLELSRYELGLLKALVERPGIVFSRAQLIEKVSPDPDMSLERTVDSHIKSIRAKIRRLDPDAEWIETHRGFGYSLAPEPEDGPPR
jgi:two-component system, OmpR family, catabolic regulation response regulator CreB